MSSKTIFIIVATALLTLFLTVNNEPVDFNFIFMSAVPVSKLIVIGVCVLIGFVLGLIVGRPRKTLSSYDNEIEKEYPKEDNNSGLSEEDKDYIN
jgi:putative membrane protein